MGSPCGSVRRLREPLRLKRPRPGLPRGRQEQQAFAACNGQTGTIFRRGRERPLCIAKQNSPRLPVLRLAAAASARPKGARTRWRLAVHASPGLPPSVATKAARVAVQSEKATPMTDSNDNPADEPEAQESQMVSLIQEMQLYGYRPFEDEPDQRPLPESRLVDGAVADMFDGLVSSLIDTRIEPDLEDLLWGVVNVFQRAVERVDRELDDNEQAQKRMQREQDGSEVKSVELERTIAEGITMIERRDTMEYFRDAAADQFKVHAKKPWLPRSGSKVNRKALTASVVSSRDFQKARRWADAQVLAPTGTRIAVSSGAKFNDVTFIYSVFDKIRAKFPDMVLLHGATDTGGERIAVCWAESRKVPSVPYEPDWGLGRAAPFRRNDQILEDMPVGVVIFPGTGIQGNMHDKARSMGIKVWDFRHLGGA